MSQKIVFEVGEQVVTIDAVRISCVNGEGLTHGLARDGLDEGDGSACITAFKRAVEV